MKQLRKKEFARDVISLGGVPFFVLVLVRIAILQNPSYLAQIAIAGVAVGIGLLVCNANLYAALSVPVAVFLSAYYNNTLFTVFAVLAYVLLFASLRYLGEKYRRSIMGTIVGVIATVVAYLFVRYIFK